MKRVLICGDRNWASCPHNPEHEALSECDMFIHDLDFFETAMVQFEAKHGPIEIVIEGCARGADYMAGHIWARDHMLPVVLTDRTQRSVTVEHFPAKWEEHNSYNGTCWCRDKTTAKCNGAGPLRNQAMLDAKPDAVIAFHKDIANSRGTADMVRRARKAGIPVWIPYKQPQLTIDF